MNYTARRINGIADGIGATRYLEIGVNKGVTFFDVRVAERTGVDPSFRFDFDSHRNESTNFFQMPSDQYFAIQKSFLRYDIVFIDGLHTFEQVARDFSNAIMHTSSRSAIVLDDTLPSDVFSAIPDQATALRQREVAGGTSKSWHGDVFKIVFYIHDFWPSLNYRTIITQGNPQTVVWRSPGLDRQPLFNNFEKISRLTYFDLQDHMQILQPMAEGEAITLCTKEINLLA